MSIALARKYRPSLFDDLVGQDTISQTLSLALDGDRLSHAYLFSGLRGSGKTSTARIFAKALLCEVGTPSQPCNSCSNCIMANESRHMDIIEMDAASNRGIDDIKELIEHTKYKPGTGRFKIFIIDEVHMLTTQAFNALLKTLEEPPDFVKFILATTDPLKLPATILSRTQHFRFKKIPQKLILSHLEHILNIEEVSYEKEALDVIARSGAGSLRDSLTLLDQAIVYSKHHVDMATVTGMLGIIEPSLLDKLLDSLLSKNEDEVLDFVRLASEYESEMVIDELTLYIKELLFSKDSRFSPIIIDRFFRVLADAKELLILGSDGEFVLSLTLFKIMEALSVSNIDDMIRTLQKELSGVKISKPAKDIADVVESSVSTPNKEEPKNQREEVKKVENAKAEENQTENDKAEDDQVENAKVETKSVETTPLEKPEVKPAEEESVVDTAAIKFKSLVQKIYDRNYDLGRIFESNISYGSYKDGSLTWHSSAEGEDKNRLISHWGIIKIFVQDFYGIDTKIINIQKTPKKKIPLDSNTLPNDQSTQTKQQNTKDASSSEVEMKSSCVSPEAGDTEAAKEKDPSELLKEPMIKEMIELFDPKKVRIRRNS